MRRTGEDWEGGRPIWLEKKKSEKEGSQSGGEGEGDALIESKKRSGST